MFRRRRMWMRSLRMARISRRGFRTERRKKGGKRKRGAGQAGRHSNKVEGGSRRLKLPFPFTKMRRRLHFMRPGYLLASCLLFATIPKCRIDLQKVAQKTPASRPARAALRGALKLPRWGKCGISQFQALPPEMRPMPHFHKWRRRIMASTGVRGFGADVVNVTVGTIFVRGARRKMSQDWTLYRTPRVFAKPHAHLTLLFLWNHE